MVCASTIFYTFLTFKQDLWEFPKDLQASTIVNKLEGNFFLQSPSEKRHFFPSNNTPGEGAKDADLENSSEGQELKQQPVRSSSLTKALHQTFFNRWWTAGVLKLGSGALLFTYSYG